MPETIRIGTRRSALAMWQARFVSDLLEKSGMKTEIIGIETRGDRVLDVAIAKIGDKGVFTQELEVMLRTGDIDIAVHSAKDMPSELSAGFELIAFTRREKAQDVFVSRKSVDELEEPEGGLRVGSSSVRRTAFLKRYYPHFRIVDMRGNLQTRIGKMQAGVCDILMLAFAGVHRMKFDHLIVKELPIDRIVPPVGQGTMAVESSIHLDPGRKGRIRESVNHPDTERVILAERAFLKTLKGGCSIPVFAHAVMENNRVYLTGGLISLDGKELIRECREAAPEESESLGKSVAEKVLERGGRRLLDEIRLKQQEVERNV
jgi:hydroxymethylbilane synthase